MREPTESEIERIELWPAKDPKGLLKYVASLWSWEDMAGETRPGIWVFVTGGWSGNEALLGAMKRSEPFMYFLRGSSIELPNGLLCVGHGRPAFEGEAATAPSRAGDRIGLDRHWQLWKTTMA